MSPRKKEPPSSHTLRQKAERRLQATQKQINQMSPEEIRHLVHEFQVHQIELEMQNDQLRETQSALEVARDRYAGLFDFSPVGYVLLNDRGRVLEVNLRFCQFLGATRKDLLQQNFVSFLDPGDQQKFRRHLKMLTPSSGSRTSEVLILRGADPPHRVRLESCVETVPTLHQEVLYRIAVVDVSEQERTLHLNENILQSANEGIYGLDSKGTITFFNRSSEELTGWKASEMLGRPSHDILHHTRPDGSPYPKKNCPVLRTLHQGEFISLDSEVLWRKDGSWFPAEYASTPILNESGQVEGAVVTFRDITERKHAEDLLRTSRDLLARQQAELQALTAKLFNVQEEERERIARALHDDISQRLALLQMKVQMALPSQAGPKDQEILDDIKNLSKDVRQIVHRYHPYTLQDLGLESAIRSLVADCMKWDQVPITLSIKNIPRHLPPERTTCLYRVAQETFQNIAKHAQATSVRCELAGEAGGLRLIIEDDGVGFTNTASSSKGLGLISMQERSHALHGNLAIDSAPGKGTKINLWIPLQETPVDTASRPLN